MAAYYGLPDMDNEQEYDEEMLTEADAPPNAQSSTEAAKSSNNFSVFGSFFDKSNNATTSAEDGEVKVPFSHKAFEGDNDSTIKNKEEGSKMNFKIPKRFSQNLNDTPNGAIDFSKYVLRIQNIPEKIPAANGDFTLSDSKERSTQLLGPVISQQTKQSSNFSVTVSFCFYL